MNNLPSIIKAEKAYLAINKPAGLLVHPTPGSTEEPTLIDWLLEHYPKIKTVGDDTKLRPGIVHRLDRETSGIMLVARTQQAFEHFKKEFQNRNVKKHYTALVTGSPRQNKGVIDLPISRVGIKRVTGEPRNKAKNTKSAITHWNVTERFSNFTLLDVAPETGRTNQIRVHLASINHPVACDPVYGGKSVLCPVGLKRLFLHASSLDITDINGNELHAEAPLADDLMHALKNLDKD